MGSVLSYFDPRYQIHNIRFYVLIAGIALSGVIFLIINATVPGTSLQIIRLEQTYAFVCLFYLYIALLASPLTQFFKGLPYRAQYLKARRAIGVSAFYYALLHILIAFFGQLDGFAGLGFLDNTFIVALLLGITAFIILTAMASTSFDFMVDKLTFPKWKLLHRFVYLAAVFILIHSLIIGTHFSNLTDPIPLVVFSALAFLLFLEAIRFDKFLVCKYPTLPNFGVTIVGLVLLLGAGLSYIFLPQGGGGTTNALGIHAAHIKAAQQAQQGNFSNIPGLSGDRSLRYTVNLEHSVSVSSNQDTNLTFRIFDANSGDSVTQYDTVYTKLMHLVIVDSQLKYFTHIHPNKNSDGTFSITTSFPHDGIYHLYIDFQPTGAFEQQIGFTLNVGSVSNTTPSTQPVDTNLTKDFGNYKVSLFEPDNLNASDLSNGNQTLTFRVRDTKTKQPITNLKPYLGALGHLVMVNESTYDYIHVHPTTSVPDTPTYSGGPDVDFLPLGLYGPIKPGLYRVFAQFNPGGNLFVADFTIKIN